MAQAKKGDKVKVHYRGTLKDGSEFDCSHGREPLEFEIDAGMMIPGFDKAVAGMEVGEKKTVEIPCEEAYGPKHDDNILEAPKDQLPEDLNVEVGLMLTLTHPSGQPVPVTVTEITDTHVILDGNHQLAGEDLTFDIELVEIAE